MGIRRRNLKRGHGEMGWGEIERKHETVCVGGGGGGYRE